MGSFQGVRSLRAARIRSPVIELVAAIVVGVGYSDALKRREYVSYDSFERVPVPMDEMAVFVVTMTLAAPVAYGVVYGCLRLAAWLVTGFMKDPPESD